MIKLSKWSTLLTHLGFRLVLLVTLLKFLKEDIQIYEVENLNLTSNEMLYLQEQPPFDKKQFVSWVKKYIKTLTPKLEGEKQEQFKKNIEGATKFLLSKLSDLQL